MESIPYEHGLILAAMLFVCGLVGVLTRRNIVLVLLSLESMLHACGLAIVAGSARRGEAEGQAMYVMILTLAAAEVAVGLGLIIQMYRRFPTVDISVLNEMKG